MRLVVIVIMILLLSPTVIFGQEEARQEPKPKRISLSGYLKFLQTVQFQDVNDDWLTDNIFHNRLNFKWYASKNITFTSELRTRFFYGETVKRIPQYRDIIDSDAGYVADIRYSGTGKLLLYSFRF